ncbi:MAG: hypothetical protein QXZ31_03570, partial [Thermofilaceae archaeon]
PPTYCLFRGPPPKVRARGPAPRSSAVERPAVVGARGDMAVRPKDENAAAGRKPRLSSRNR